MATEEALRVGAAVDLEGARSVDESYLNRVPDGGWSLVGRRCGNCGETLFGRRDPACPRCGNTLLADAELSPTGRLWAFTVLRSPPPGQRRSAFPMLPGGLGLVELDDDGVRVAAPLDVAIERLAIGLPLMLEVFELYHDGEDQAAVLGFRFKEASALTTTTS